MDNKLQMQNSVKGTLRQFLLKAYKFSGCHGGIFISSRIILLHVFCAANILTHILFQILAQKQHYPIYYYYFVCKIVIQCLVLYNIVLLPYSKSQSGLLWIVLYFSATASDTVTIETCCPYIDGWLEKCHNIIIRRNNFLTRTACS